MGRLLLWAPCSTPGSSPGFGSRGTWDRSCQHSRVMAAREDSSLQFFDAVVAGEGSKSPESRRGCPAARIQLMCSVLLVAGVTVTQMAECPLL